MKRKEFKVGEVFKCGLVKLKAKKTNKVVHACRYCFISELTSDCRAFKQVLGECIGLKREDKTDVIFVKVENLL